MIGKNGQLRGSLRIPLPAGHSVYFLIMTARHIEGGFFAREH